MSAQQHDGDAGRDGELVQDQNGGPTMKIHDWINSAAPGNTIVYHISGDEDQFTGLGRQAKLVWDAHELGLVFLSQRRRSDGLLDYQATRISPRTARLLGVLPRPHRVAA